MIFLMPIWLVLANQSIFSVTPTQFDAIVVFGAAVIKNSYPSKVLELRLDTSIKKYNEGIASEIIVSGDGRKSDYNEPLVMQNYLVQNGIPLNAIRLDTGGITTLDTCWRLKHVFNVNTVALISQDFHLPRADYLCQEQGLQTGLFPAPSSSPRVTVSGTIREYPALLYNISLLMTNTYLKVD